MKEVTTKTVFKLVTEVLSKPDCEEFTIDQVREVVHDEQKLFSDKVDAVGKFLVGKENASKVFVDAFAKYGEWDIDERKFLSDTIMLKRFHDVSIIRFGYQTEKVIFSVLKTAMDFKQTMNLLNEEIKEKSEEEVFENCETENLTKEHFDAKEVSLKEIKKETKSEFEGIIKKDEPKKKEEKESENVKRVEKETKASVANEESEEVNDVDLSMYIDEDKFNEAIKDLGVDVKTMKENIAKGFEQINALTSEHPEVGALEKGGKFVFERVQRKGKNRNLVFVHNKMIGLSIPDWEGGEVRCKLIFNTEDTPVVTAS